VRAMRRLFVDRQHSFHRSKTQARRDNFELRIRHELDGARMSKAPEGRATAAQQFNRWSGDPCRAAKMTSHRGRDEPRPLARARANFVVSSRRDPRNEQTVVRWLNIAGTGPLLSAALHTVEL
jgi:hypothetical protein